MHQRRVTITPHVVGMMAATLLAVQGASPALAAEASGWDTAAHSKVRLIAGKSVRQGMTTVYRAGLEVRLDPGWKTYWRYPGDSGLPPRFRFDRSENVRSVAVRWPAPRRLADDGGTSIGYAGSIILPLHIEPEVPERAVVLRLDLDYAVCEKLCVPVEAKAELRISGKETAHEAALAAAEARVPKPAALGAEGPLAIRALRREQGMAPSRIVVDVVATAAEVDLFVEGPTAEWALPLPEPLSGALPGVKRFAFALDGVPPGATAAGAALRLTAVSGDAAIEVTTRLD